MKKSSVELGVGIFVLIGIICVGYLTVQLGKMELLGDDHYFLNARFHSVSGLKAGAQVEIAGVKVGQVDSITLDTKDHVALVRLKILRNVELTDDVIASVKTAGLIGDKYGLYLTKSPYLICYKRQYQKWFQNLRSGSREHAQGAGRSRKSLFPAYMGM
jgi:phospholipid/cholesterol/gamma-HCH transport system substrate-binding protein